jgi:hypothetical protein
MYPHMHHAVVYTNVNTKEDVEVVDVTVVKNNSDDITVYKTNQGNWEQSLFHQHHILKTTESE